MLGLTAEKLDARHSPRTGVGRESMKRGLTEWRYEGSALGAHSWIISPTWLARR